MTTRAKFDGLRVWKHNLPCLCGAVEGWMIVDDRYSHDDTRNPGGTYATRAEARRRLDEIRRQRRAQEHAARRAEVQR